MALVIVALVALTLLLSRVVPTESCTDVYRTQLQRLEELDDKVHHILIPLSFADELYCLRSSSWLVRRRVLRSIDGATATHA